MRSFETPDLEIFKFKKEIVVLASAPAAPTTNEQAAENALLSELGGISARDNIFSFTD